MKTLIFMCALSGLGSALLTAAYHQNKIEEVTEEYETAIEEIYYHEEVDNAQGYYHNYAEGKTVYVYPKAIPFSTDKQNADTLEAWIQNDTLYIVPLNL